MRSPVEQRARLSMGLGCGMVYMHPLEVLEHELTLVSTRKLCAG